MCPGPTTPGGQPYSHPHFLEEETEARIAEITCSSPRGHRREMLKFGPHSLWLQGALHFQHILPDVVTSLSRQVDDKTTIACVQLKSM